MKILIAIESCLEHVNRHQAMLDTWLTGEFRFFTAYPPLEDMLNDKSRFFDHAVYVPVPDDYAHLPEKTKCICEYALQSDFDYILKVDTDEYVSILRALASGFENYDYSGFVRDDGFQPQYCYGPAYWLSKRSLKILAEADWPKYAVSGFETCEDVMVGAVLAAHGIFPHHDPRYALYHDVLPDNDIISSHLSNAGKKFQIEFMYEAHRKANP